MQKQKKIEKLVHPFGFTVGIYYDAWNYERQISDLFATQHI
jgi:hypothetical protein